MADTFIQQRNDANLNPFFRGECPVVRQFATIAQDAARAIPLAPFTVMSRIASTRYYTPLRDVDPAAAPATLTTGAIGGTLAAFAALSSASFKIGIDGETPFEVVVDFSGIDSVLDTPGKMVTGAIGSINTFKAVADGQFGIAIDGQAAQQIGPVDFTGLDSNQDTPGYWTCGTNGDVIANWDGLTDAAFSMVVNGLSIDTGAMDFTSCLTFGDVVNSINFALKGKATCDYDWKTNKFKFTSPTTGELSSVAAPGAPAAGTDISVAAWLNAAAGAATAGTGGEGTAQTIPDLINAAAAGQFFCFNNGGALVFVSPTAGEVSAVSVLTAGAAGTDISGASYLNGLTGTGTPAAGTGGEGLGESIVDIINAELAGRATVGFDGDKFIFWSPTTGAYSAVSYLTAGTTGTDISGASYLNGLTGTGVLGAATGATGSDVPAGIYIGPSITAAAIVAADIVNCQILVGDAIVDDSQVVWENSLTKNSVVTRLIMTAEDALFQRGLVLQQSTDVVAIENT